MKSFTMPGSLFLFFSFFLNMAFAQPEPGDVFREYMWYKKNGDAGGALRVGGREGTTNWGTVIENGFWVTQNISPGYDIDLHDAIKAEIVIEKILCHDGTFSLGIQINDHDWIDIPEAENIPVSQHQYQHHIYPVVSIPLELLKAGDQNKFRMRVNADHSWNWPQNLIYGVHFRIYYDPDLKQHPSGKIISPASNDTLGEEVVLKTKAESPNNKIERVDYIGYYEDVNFEGDGIYRQWHYHFFHGDILHHIGSEFKTPFEVVWQTSWVPDQEEPMKIAARIIDETGMIYFSEPVEGLLLDRNEFSVELCKPYNIPKKWVTRRSDFVENFDVKGSVSNAKAYQIVWTSWSPGYMNGIYVNDVKVFDKEGEKYRYWAHRVTIDDLVSLKKGVNKLKTGKTPKIDGNTVHGMEVEWPGIMVLIKYDKKSTFEFGESHLKNSKDFVLNQNYPKPFNSSTLIHYYIKESNLTNLQIYNLNGRNVKTLVNDYQIKGNHYIKWDGTDNIGNIVSTGSYITPLKERMKK